MRVQKTSRHVYDDQDDNWYEFDTQEDIDAFIQAASQGDIRDRFEETRGASNLGAFFVPVTASAGVVLNFDPDRAQVRLKYNDDTTATSKCLVGRKEQLQGTNPTGYRLAVGETLAFDTQGELWVVGINAPSVAAILSVFFTTLLP